MEKWTIIKCYAKLQKSEKKIKNAENEYKRIHVNKHQFQMS